MDDEYKIESERHLIELFSVMMVQLRVLGKEEAEDGSPQTRAIPPLQLEQSRDDSPAEGLVKFEGTIKLATLGNPEFSVFVALNEMLGISELPEHPSSGQSRILSMFEDLSLQKDGSTIMIDEPELSLHIDLQEIMVTRLTKLFPHLRFIFSTHSPNVIMGHTEKVVEVPPREEV